MRGLKLCTPDIVGTNKVASFTDAWIETMFDSYIYFKSEVASFTDAWIETGLK